MVVPYLCYNTPLPGRSIPTIEVGGYTRRNLYPIMNLPISSFRTWRQTWGRLLCGLRQEGSRGWVQDISTYSDYGVQVNSGTHIDRSTWVLMTKTSSFHPLNTKVCKYVFLRTRFLGRNQSPWNVRLPFSVFCLSKFLVWSTITRQLLVRRPPSISSCRSSATVKYISRVPSKALFHCKLVYKVSLLRR